MEVYSDRAKWNRGLELARAANEARDRIIEAQSLKNQRIAELVEPYVNRSPTDRTLMYHPDRHYLYSEEVEKLVLEEYRMSITTFEVLSQLAGELIGRGSKVTNPDPYPGNS